MPAHTESTALPIQDVLEVGTEYADTYGPPSWVAKPQESAVNSQEVEAHVMGMAWAQVAATQECEEVAATHRLGGVRAVTWDLIKKERAQSETCAALAKIIN